jgi:hypothetical protein
MLGSISFLRENGWVHLKTKPCQRGSLYIAGAGEEADAQCSAARFGSPEGGTPDVVCAQRKVFQLEKTTKILSFIVRNKRIVLGPEDKIPDRWSPAIRSVNLDRLIKLSSVYLAFQVLLQ